MYDIKCNIFYFKVAKEILLECGNRASECRLFGTRVSYYHGTLDRITMQ